MKSTKQSVDKPLYGFIIALAAGGIVILASASMALGEQDFGHAGYYVLRQIVFGGLLGLIGFFAAQYIPYRWWRRAALPLLVATFILMALVFIPEFGFSSGGATRWLRFGFFSFQPAEVMKLVFVMYLASWLDARRKEVSSVAYGTLPFVIMLGVLSIFLIMQPDIGTLGIIVVSSGLLYYLGGGRISQMATLSALGVALLFLLIQLAPYRSHRLQVFLNPGLDPQGIGYQINQAFIAIGSGGITGRGFGLGVQKYNYLPEPMGDSIFAIFAEETGFIGACILMFLFLAFIWRGFIIAKRAPDVFGKLLAAGIVVSIATQAYINMAAISGLLPLTGVPLPLVSYGSTSLAITLVSTGILLNISKYGSIPARSSY